MSEYEAVIGLEVHAQLATRTKMFSGATIVFGREANSQVDPVSLGLPGTLPVINDHAVELAVMAALALGCTVNERSKFDRKHYFYPDLPKGYQISQYDEPYASGGAVRIDLEDGSRKDIGLTRIHMEEDAGKLIHQGGGSKSEVDLNRAGTPLIEIVSEPEIASPQEAYGYLLELKRTLKYCGVSDCEMQEGSLRCDANVSVRPVGQAEFGTKVEVKNLNSFRAVEAAIQHEIEAQTALHKAGRYAEVVQETKLWDPDSKTTRSMRGKEGSADYRYFPEPDLPPLHVTSDRLERIRALLPELPRTRQERFAQEHGLNEAVAAELTAERSVADYFEALLAHGVPAKLASNWTREEAIRLAAVKHVSLEAAAPVQKMAELVKLVDAGKVARVVAKGACDELFASDEAPADYFGKRGMIQEADAGQLAEWVKTVISENAKVVDDVRGGKTAAIGRLIGATMKVSGGKANPKEVKPEICRQLGVEV